MSVVDNIALPNRRAALACRCPEARQGQRLRQASSPTASGCDRRTSGGTAGQYSGGNQQKVVIAKWLGREPELIILDEPTRGVDVGAKAEIHRLVRALADNGAAVLVVSSDLPELLDLSDVIHVIRDGRVGGHAPRGRGRREESHDARGRRRAGDVMTDTTQRDDAPPRRPSRSRARGPALRRCCCGCPSAASSSSPLVLIVFAAVFVDGFASFVNVTDVFYRAAPIGIVAVGMTFVVISGNYLDLSVVAQVATSAVILIAVSNASNLLRRGPGRGRSWPCVYGLVNGVAVGYFKANAVIVTLSTTYVGLGVLRWLSGGSIFFGPKDGPIRASGEVEVLGLVPLSAVVLAGHGRGCWRSSSIGPTSASPSAPSAPTRRRPGSRGSTPPGGGRGIPHHLALGHGRRVRPGRLLQHRGLDHGRRLRLRRPRRDHHRRHERLRRPGQHPRARSSA